MSERAVVILPDDPQDGSPSWDEVNQREELPTVGIAAVPVQVDGPVQTQELPPRTSVMRTVTVEASPAAPAELLAADKRRKRALILAHDQDLYVGLRSGDVETGNGALWPKGAQLILFGSSRVMVRAATGSTRVSVITESWAD